MNKIKKIFIFICSFILDILGIFIFKDIFYAKKIIIKYAINPFDICEKQPQLWNNIKLLFVFSYIISSIIISNNIFKIIKNIKENNDKNSKKNNNYYNKNNQKNIKRNKIAKKRKKLKSSIDIINFDENYEKKLEICVGKIPEINEKIYIPEKGLYQNILITGTIGTGKTSSAMYPFTEQLIEYESENYDKKIGMLILDVKGNYFNQVRKFAYKYNRLDDVIVIELGGKYKYNPLNKPNLKASVLANRLKVILELFSGKTTESYWIDKSEQILCECIKFCRLYNDGYVNFEELHNLVTNQNYYIEKIEIVKKLFQKNKFSKEECYDLLTSITFFEKEFYKLDSRTMSILKSEITRITNCFISDYQVSKTFNPTQIEQNFYGLEEILSKGKIVVLNMNIAEYKNLSKIIAAYLKLDFQSEVLSRLAQNNKNKTRTVAFISDEYHEYITETDADFFAQSREAKCINIVATQSYTSLLKTLNDESILKVVIQNLINKIWFRTDDTYTIEEVQKQIGKEEKEKYLKVYRKMQKKLNTHMLRKHLNLQILIFQKVLALHMKKIMFLIQNFLHKN